jgi:large subunit ribosomal protein L3
MTLGSITYKRGMTTILSDDGSCVPVTIVEFVPMTVIQVKTEAKDGYCAIQVGYDPTKTHRVNKAEKVHQATDVTRDKKSKISDIKFHAGGPFRRLKEFRIDNPQDYKPGQVIIPDFISEGTVVDAVGTTKGKGFAGAVKRYHFRGQSRSHGTSKTHRKPMSAGATDAARCFKGKRGPGHMGVAHHTEKNLVVVKVDSDLNLFAIRGAVPGPDGGEIIIKPALRAGHPEKK